MIAGEAIPHGATYLNVVAAECNPTLEATRAARLDAARAYMRALGASIAAGEAMPELDHDNTALCSGSQRLLALCGMVGVDAPMLLSVIE